MYSEITSLPSDLKQEVSDFVVFLKQKSKNKAINKVEEPIATYKAKLSDILLKGPVFSEEQIQKIEETRKH